MNYKNNVRRASLVAVGVLTALTAANAAVTLDAGFDTDGLAFIDFSTSTDSARAVAMDADGKILLAGPRAARARWSVLCRCGWRSCA